MAGLRKLALRHHLGRPGQASRLVPAGRFLRHRPGRKSLQDLNDRHDQGRLLLQLVHAVRPQCSCRTGQRRQGRPHGRFRSGSLPAGPRFRRPRQLPRQVAPRHVHASEGSLARLGHAPHARQRPVLRRHAARLESCAVAGGAKATRNSSSTAKNSPPPLAPVRKTTSATPGAIRTCSRSRITPKP